MENLLKYHPLNNRKTIEQLFYGLFEDGKWIIESGKWNDEQDTISDINVGDL